MCWKYLSRLDFSKLDMMLSTEIAIFFLHFFVLFIDRFCFFPSALRLVGPDSVQNCSLTYIISRFLVAALERQNVPFIRRINCSSMQNRNHLSVNYLRQAKLWIRQTVSLSATVISENSLITMSATATVVRISWLKRQN